MGWLAGTTEPWEPETDRDVGFRLSTELRELLPIGSSLEGRNRHYSKGVRADDWSWQVLWQGLGGAAGTVYVEVRQSVWESLPEDVARLAATSLCGQLRATRIDLAGDDLRPRAMTPADYFAWREVAETRTRRDGWELTLRGDGGEKLTIGSRSSERYGRIYIGHGGVRHEIELKAALARATAAAVVAGEALAGLWASEWQRLVRWGA
jgi:DNA relaxase NicK